MVKPECLNEFKKLKDFRGAGYNEKFDEEAEKMKKLYYEEHKI